MYPRSNLPHLLRPGRVFLHEGDEDGAGDDKDSRGDDGHAPADDAEEEGGEGGGEHAAQLLRRGPDVEVQVGS